MALTATVRARVDENLKLQAQTVLSEIGISTSQAINMFLKKIVAEKDIPFKTKVPSARLQQAFDEVDRDEGETYEVNSYEELVEALKDNV